MKKKIYLITTILLSAAVLSLSSCLKDPRYVDFSKVGTLVELPLAAANGLGNLTPEALPILATPQPIQVVVNVASPSALSSALTVTLAVDQAALTAYNHANGLDTGTNVPYVLPPDGSYTISSLKVTIPAGQRSASLNIQVTTTLLDPAGLYIIPISIVDASGQKISNYKTILLNVQAKNKYDGTYSLKGYIHRDADLSLGGPIIGMSSDLATTGANSVSFKQVWANGSETGGVNPIIFAIDPTTNAITITSQANASLTNIAGYPSRYDPATKTFYVSFIWNGTDPNHRSATDTLTYTGPRP
jgi:hypothetical protein